MEMVQGTETDRISVLVVDDEFGPRESLRFLLKDKYQVHCAEGVDGGIKWLREACPDVVILDIKMPDKSGIEGLREIRTIDKAVSVIMLTGFGTLESAQEAIRLGANDYIKKPFDAQEMLDTVERYASQTQIARRRAHAARELENLRSRMEEELAEKEHLASLGQASSEFVHDLKNPLTVIYGYVQLLMEQLDSANYRLGESSKEVIDYLSRIEKSVQRCQEMSELWRDLGKKEKARMRDTNISEIVKEAVENSEPLAASRGARVELENGPSECVVFGDRVQLYRALQNVISNAVQALPEKGGVVRVGWGSNDEYAEIHVSDNGCGIPPDKLENVFNPYYTTKGGSGGMGIGLFITKKVVEIHDGYMQLSNNEGRGATAKIFLPRAKATC